MVCIAFRTFKMLILLLCALLLTGCRQNPSQEELFSGLYSHFSEYGFTHFAVETLAEGDCEVPIYNAGVWQRMKVDEEEVLVYFDESNRADYLLQMSNVSGFTCAGRFGLRFIVLYSGSNEKLISAVENMPS